MSSLSWSLFAILAALLYYFYTWSKKKHEYWKKKGVKYAKPVPFFGSLLPAVLTQKPNNYIPFDVYHAFPEEKMVGYYCFTRPALVIRDANLIEKITVKDFQHFVDRPHFGIEKNCTLSKALFSLSSKDWRNVRYRMSPGFSTGKLKFIYNHMDECSDALIQRITKSQKNNDINHNLRHYALHTLSSGVYGTEVKDESAVDDFAQMSNLFFESSKPTILRQLFMKYFKNAAEFLNLSFFNGDPETYFKTLLSNTFEFRSKSNVRRNDFTDFLLKLKSKGKVEVIEKNADDAYLTMEHNEDVETFEFTDEIINAMALQFIMAGFLPLVQVSLYTLFELSLHTEAQKKAREQVDEMYAKHGGFTYTSIRDMTYLDQCIYEVLRIHSLVDNLERICTKDYTTDDGIEIEKGTIVMIPVMEIHKDPKLFPNPEVFDPERFAEDKSIPSVYLPFGSGPRICIGMRYAMLQMKVALAKIIHNFSFELSQGIKPKMEFNRKSLMPILTSKILIDFTPLK